LLLKTNEGKVANFGSDRKKYISLYEGKKAKANLSKRLSLLALCVCASADAGVGV
jgi:hypothetical protein